MRLNQKLLSLAALSSNAMAQNASLPTSEPTTLPPAVRTGEVTLDVIQTSYTSFTGAQASLGNVTLYVPVRTVVAANATSGLLPFSNATATARGTGNTPIVIPAGNTSYIIPTGLPTALPTSLISGADKQIAGFGAMLGLGVAFAAVG